ncbi:unnamed protein product, partial [Mesorhabditis spiculigera]
MLKLQCLIFYYFLCQIGAQNIELTTVILPVTTTNNSSPAPTASSSASNSTQNGLTSLLPLNLTTTQIPTISAITANTTLNSLGTTLNASATSSLPTDLPRTSTTVLPTQIPGNITTPPPLPTPAPQSASFNWALFIGGFVLCVSTLCLCLFGYRMFIHRVEENVAYSYTR